MSIQTQRRKAALGRFWRDFRHDRGGMEGLIILAILERLQLTRHGEWLEVRLGAA